MKLSIVIVNYNVKFFLEQCLLSVIKAQNQLFLLNSSFSSEIFVVDNNSVDSSTTMVIEKFPDVKLIKNFDNKGFSAANNQAIRESKGEYVLLLNPDTVIEESTFIKIIPFMDQHLEAGGMGVKMIDGSGNFLPESKRSFPTPSIAFYKTFGLSRLFPKSKVFGKYHLGYLDKEEINEVEVLSGAFMLIRKTVLDKIGLLDETFFMYGEDIDISYRIKEAGFKNFYFPQTQIIHYKGESTKKSSVNYVFTFYKAMIIFAKKHFSPKSAKLFSLFINLAIYFRASISIIHRAVIKFTLPFFDIISVFAGFWIVKLFWENASFGHGANYPSGLVIKVLPLYTFLMIFGIAFLKNYSKPYNLWRLIKGVLLGAVLISTVYAFFEESARYSRALIVLGTFASILITIFTRLMANFFENKAFSLKFTREIRLAIVGSKEEGKRVLELLERSQIDFKNAGLITPDLNNDNQKGFIGNLNQINELVKIYKINELVFCSEDISSSQIIKIMTTLESKDVGFKIAPQNSLFIIGSNHKNRTGDFYTIDIQINISTLKNKFNKRFVDIISAVLFFIVSPLLVWFQKDKKAFFENIFHVLVRKKTWVGYFKNVSGNDLPPLPEGILSPTAINSNKYSNEKKEELNLVYAKDYQVINDIQIILNNLKRLDARF